MKNFIACCGLDCETCKARLATINNDDALRVKVAAEWSELFHSEITPEMINCTGCRLEGVKVPYCESMCPIRKCARNKNYATCGECSEIDTCEKLSFVISDMPEALRNLKS